MNEIVWAHRAFLGTPPCETVLQEIQPGGSVHWSRMFEWPWAIHVSGMSPRDVVLEAGGGRSPFQFALARRAKRVVNLDDDQVSLDDVDVMARQSGVHNLIVRRGDLRHIGYTDAAFDRVFCISVLEHIENPETVATELWRVLRPGGTLVVTLDVASYARWNHSIDLDKAAVLTWRWGLVVPAFPDDGLTATFEEINPTPLEPRSVDLRVLCMKVHKPS